jgi:hypothetical protein
MTAANAVAGAQGGREARTGGGGGGKDARAPAAETPRTAWI